MNIFKFIPLLCLLTTAFAAIYGIDYPSHLVRQRRAIYHEDNPHHVLSRRNVDLKLSDSPGLYGDSVEVQESPRIARDLSPSVKEDLKKIFTIENFLSITQKFLKIVLKITETITGYLPANAVKQAIQGLGFPGSEAVATIAEEIMKFINELTAEVAKSDFIVGKPTKENFWKLLSDTLLLGLKKGLRFNALMLNGAKKVFKETDATKYNLLDNFQVTHPVAKKLLENLHKFAGQLLRGLEKISNDKIKNTLVGFIKMVSLPFAKDLAQIIDILISGVNAASKELLQTKFIKEDVNIKNVNQFIVAAIKTITITTLEQLDGILKIILTAVQVTKGVPVDLNVGPLPDVSLPEGFAIDVINKVIGFFVNINAEEVLKQIHNFVSFTARFVLDVTNDPGVQSIPDIIRVVGKQLTEAGANAAAFFIEHAHNGALEATNSKFIKEAPSWENARDFLLASIKSGLKLGIEITNNIKQYFDSSVANLITVPNLVKDILETVIPESALSAVQGKVKAVTKGIEALTGIIPANAIKGFIISSDLPFNKELSTTAVKTMKWVNDLAKLLSQSKFVNGKATIENAVLAITEIIKLGISSGLLLIAEILGILESLF